MRGTANLLEIQDMKSERTEAARRDRITMADAAGRSTAAPINALMALAGEMFCLHGHDLSIVQAAGAVEEICGLPAEALAGRRLRDFAHPDDRPAVIALWSKISAGEAPPLLEFRLVHPDGSIVRVEVGVFAVPDGTGGFGSAIRDVTRFHPARGKIRSGRDYVSSGIAAAEIAAGMAHELSQPLASIVLAAENALTAITAAPAETALVAQKLERIAQQAARAAKLIDHMRFFGRRESGVPQPIDLAEALDGALLILDGRLRRAKVEIVRDIAPDLPRLLGTLVLVEQVIINLITNACDACQAARPPLSGGRRKIGVTAFAEGGSVVLIVADHAGGIPEADLPKLFQPFFTTKAPGEGMGLGLSISYGIVSDMGGTMTARNAKGGAVFELRLPANSEGATV
jgi:PAS domain S-box-containing protein